MKTAKTLFEKIWERHVVYQEKGSPAIIYIDGHLLHEVTSPQAFANLRKKGLKVRRPDLTLATCDHNVSTIDQMNISDLLSKKQVETLKKNCEDFGIRFFGLDSPNQGIIHVIGPELGFVKPGMTIVCGDSHTSTNGAFGALAWGIGTSEVEMVLATQSLLLTKPKTMEIFIEGKLGKGVVAKDLILWIIKKIGVNGATSYAVEYRGKLIKRMNMEERMTICNMTIEAGGRMGMVAPDEITFAYLKDKEFAPKGEEFEKAVDFWRTLASDDDACYDKSVRINASEIEPLITYGTNPEMVIKINQRIPKPEDIDRTDKRNELIKALRYMNLTPGSKLEGLKIDEVFIGSCTNARLSDLREAAKIAKKGKVKKWVKAIVVPGSRRVKREAEKEGLDQIFKQAGFQWRWSGCSACLGMNEDKVAPKHYCISTSNRNYEGRQGPQARTFLASPITAAACALEGKIVDVRKYL